MSRDSRERRALAVVAIVVATMSACRQKESPVEETPYPAVLGEESDAELKAKHHAEEAFTLVQPAGTFRLLIFKLPKASEADSDYRVLVYRRQGTTYVRHGAENNLVNFERPRLNEGPPRRVETTMNRLGVRHHVAIDAKGWQLVPSDGVEDGGFLIGHPQP
jgi:hypothetical protein